MSKINNYIFISAMAVWFVCTIFIITKIQSTCLLLEMDSVGNILITMIGLIISSIVGFSISLIHPDDHNIKRRMIFTAGLVGLIGIIISILGAEFKNILF